jgi:hypothetical protein
MDKEDVNLTDHEADVQLFLIIRCWKFVSAGHLKH